MRFIVSWHTRATFVAPHRVTSSATRTTTGLPVIGWTRPRMSWPTNGSCDQMASRILSSSVGLSSNMIDSTVTDTSSNGISAKKP